MPTHWIYYEASTSDAKGRQPGRGLRFSWPWRWFRRRPERSRNITVASPVSGDGRRRWPWLLLLLLLLLAGAGMAGFILSDDDPDETETTTLTSQTGAAAPSEDRIDTPEEGNPSTAPGQTADPRSRSSGAASISLPDLPSPDGDLDVEPPRCPPGEATYVVTSDGTVQNLNDLDGNQMDEFLRALDDSNVSLDDLPPVLQQRIDLLKQAGHLGHDALNRLR